MADLLELVLNIVFELLGAVADSPGAWRFCVPVLAAWAVSTFICWGAPGCARICLSLLVLLAGVAGGVLWESPSRRDGN